MMRISVFCSESVDLCDLVLLVLLVDLVREGISAILERFGRNQMRSGRVDTRRKRLLFGFDQRTRAAAVHRKLHVAGIRDKKDRKPKWSRSRTYVR